MPNIFQEAKKGTNPKRYVPVVFHHTPTVKPREFHGRRYMTLCKSSTITKNSGWRDHPACKLQGQWMSKAGFTPGQTVEVKVYQKKLVISVIREREENFPKRWA